MLSYHTSPLAQPGVGDSGGMNVYVRELVTALAHAGVEVTTYTRAWRPGLAREVVVEPNHRVVHVPAGEFGAAKEELESLVPAFTDFVLDDMRHRHPADVVHANYWLSGLAGHSIKHEMGIPLTATFHTFARVKAEGGDPEPERRERAEASIIGCSDAICVSCDEEEEQFRRLYGDPPGRVEIVAPGVEHAFFTPGDRGGARHALGMSDGPVLLFVGRIQPLKGVDVVAAMVETTPSLREKLQVVVCGGPSGSGLEHPHALQELAVALGVDDLVRFVPPVDRVRLAEWYRAADVCVVPSYSESFGLVAVEAQACGTPVVAARVGGLPTAVADGVSGLLVDGHDPAVWARALCDAVSDPDRLHRMSQSAVGHAARFGWDATTDATLEVYRDALAARAHRLAAAQA